MNKLTALAVYSSLGLLFAIGCDTPSTRIKKNPALYNSFPADVQANIQQGKISVGYNKDMVGMALGKPDREYTRTTATGTTEVWSYTSVYTTTDRQRVSGQFRVRDSDGVYRNVADDVWIDVQQQHEYERLRVEFENGVVKAIENLNR
jgi:hypothetical protein